MMKNTLNIFAAILCLTAFSKSTSLQAQEARPGKEQQEELFNKLDLTEGQKVKFTKIQKLYRSEISKLRREGRSMETREEIQSLGTQKDAELKQLLSDEQFAIYKAYNKKRGRSKSGNRN